MPAVRVLSLEGEAARRYPSVVAIPARGAPTATIQVAALDGLQLTCQVRGPASSDRLLVFLPALGVPLGYYEPLLTAWAGRGRRVLGVEHRGQPLSPAGDLRSRPFGYSSTIHQDLPAVFALPEVRRAEHLTLVGHSMGGVLALLATACGALVTDAVVTVGTGTSWCAAQAGVLGKVRRHASATFVAATASALGYWPGHRLGFAGRQPATIVHDWAHEARTGRFDLRGDPYDYEAALARSEVPTLMIGIEGDPWVSARAVALLARRATGSRSSAAAVTKHHVPAQQELALDHFTWARRAPAAVIDPVERWLTRLA